VGQVDRMNKPLSQNDVCRQYGSHFSPPDAGERLGIALSSLSKLPLNALRHPAEHGTCGWYIWGGELSEEADFFDALCVHHLEEFAPSLVPYLGLEPGWRVLLAPGQIDVWYDQDLLNI
jgi:hypothetical protein